MVKSFNLFPLLLCLLLLHSMVQASSPSQKDFGFLEPFNDTSLVESGLGLTGSHCRCLPVYSAQPGHMVGRV